MLDLVVARVLPETLVVQVCLIELDGGALVTHHELLEVEEAQIPRITFLIGEEPRECAGVRYGRADLKLPHAAVGVRVAHEGSPVLEVLCLVGGQGHLADVGDHVLVRHIVVDELGLVVCVEQIKELGSLPHSVSTKQVVPLVVPPVHVPHREVVILRHLDGSAGLLEVLRCLHLLKFHLTVEGIKQLVV